MAIIVRTKEELEKAVNSKVHGILVKGELAEKLNTSRKLKTVSTVTITALSAALAAAPFTGGLSLVAAAPIAVLTGLEIALIVAVVFLGLALVLMIFKEYDIVKFKGKHGDTEAELELNRKTA